MTKNIETNSSFNASCWFSDSDAGQHQQSKYDEIIEYLKLDDGYWLENDIWDIKDVLFKDTNVNIEYKIRDRYIKIDYIKNEILKNEIKYYLIYSLKNKFFKVSKVLNEGQYAIKYLVNFIDTYYINDISFKDISIDSDKWKLFLISKGLKLNKNNQICNKTYRYICNVVCSFIKDFYDDREETEKDIWYSKNIKGSLIPASGVCTRVIGRLDFNNIPIFYRDTVKKYYKTIVTKKSWNHCAQKMVNLNYFFSKFYSNGYTDGFIENLSRQDIENYLYWIYDDYKDKNVTYRSKFISYIRTFLEYIQMEQYDKAPKKEISLLIFKYDIPKREFNKNDVKKVKFVPDSILKQFDNNIMHLDRPQYIPIYILLRETRWRGTDILDLKYNNCLEQVWNNNKQSYNYYLCGEINKVGIAKLKIPIRNEVAQIVRKAIDKAKELSTEENNLEKYLFNTYEGKQKGRPLNKASLLYTINRLIKEKQIKDVNGELYHFRLNSLSSARKSAHT